MIRHFCLAAAAAAVLAAPTSAQQRPAQASPQARPATPAPAAAPRTTAPLTAQERARLTAIGERGRLLFELTRAAAVTTRDMLSRIPDPAAAGIDGWIAVPDGNSYTVTYYAEGAQGPVAVYRARVTGAQLSGQQVFTGASRPALNATERRMAAASEAVATLERLPCPMDATFNVLVVPPTSAEGPIEVYKMSPQTQRGRVPVGGHYLATVAPDGSIASTRAFTNRCVDLEVPTDSVELAGAPPPAPMAVTHLLDPLPTEIHVFLSLWTGRPMVVATGEPERLWTISAGRIGLLGAQRTPLPGPGR